MQPIFVLTHPGQHNHHLLAHRLGVINPPTLALDPQQNGKTKDAIEPNNGFIGIVIDQNGG